MRLYNLEDRLSEVETALTQAQMTLYTLACVADHEEAEADNVIRIRTLMENIGSIVAQATSLKFKIMMEEPEHPKAVYWTFPDGENPKEATREEWEKASAGEAKEMVAYLTNGEKGVNLSPIGDDD